MINAEDDHHLCQISYLIKITLRILMCLWDFWEDWNYGSCFISFPSCLIWIWVINTFKYFIFFCNHLLSELSLKMTHFYAIGWVSSYHIFKRRNQEIWLQNPPSFLDLPTSFGDWGVWVILSPKSVPVPKSDPASCLGTLRYLNRFKKISNHNERCCHCIHMEVQNKTCQQLLLITADML